jgi:5'-methylthioadenosine phosphorylase
MGQITIGLIGGTGLGEALGAESGERIDLETPFGSPSGPILQAPISDRDVFIIQRHGDGHVHNPSSVPYRANIHALKQLGVTHLVASGATGSLREQIRPRDLVIVDQFIDKTYKRPNTFFDSAAVHVELSKPVCPVMHSWLLNAAETLGDVTVHKSGTYVCMEGPSFSTEAESHMHRSWGGDLIGMTAMPEARLAREAEIAYALIALPTDYDCWKPHAPQLEQTQLLAEIIENVKVATAQSIRLLRHALSDTTLLSERPSPAHDALKLGIWSEIDKIPSAEIEKLRVIWGRYFE